MMRLSSSSPKSQPISLPLFASSVENSHSPFRFSHSRRTNCGRGYSGRGMLAAAVFVSFTVSVLNARVSPLDGLLCYDPDWLRSKPEATETRRSAVRGLGHLMEG